MAGTWESQNKVLPGAYVNIRTNEPLSIAQGERGTVVILQEMTKGTNKQIYKLTASENDLPNDVTAADKKLATEALKNASTVLIYKLPTTHTQDDVEEALEALKTVNWNVICYPYDADGSTEIKAVIKTYIGVMRETEGVKCQAVLANYAGDNEGIINVTQGVVLSGNASLTAAEVTAWVAGATAGASITTSNTGKSYAGAVDISPRLTKTEMEAAVAAGKFIFKVDNAQNVTVVYDINSLTTTTAEKGKVFTKNRVVRTLDNIANDIASIFESNYIGQVNNNEDGRTMLRAAFVDYFATLQNMGAIQNFVADDISVISGTDSDAVVVDAAIQPVDSVEKLYITVNLS